MNKILHVVILFSVSLVACLAIQTRATPASVSPPLSVSTSNALLTEVSTPSPAPEEWDLDGWEIVWHDEFDSPELNRENWDFDIGDHGWGNAELQAHTDRPENAYIKDGMLIIAARDDLKLSEETPYSSARIKTEGLHSWRYGRVEASMKLPYGQGIWPAFWLHGDGSDHCWPGCGEIDIMENIGKMPDHIYGTVHGPGYSDSNSIGSSMVVSAGSLSDNFHVFAVEWEEHEIRWYYDNYEYFRITPGDLPGDWVFNHTFYVIISLSVGGNWPGYPDDTTIFPQYLTVDYVRVYQRP